MYTISFAFIIAGAIMVYGSGLILDLFKVKNDMKKVLILKFAGLGVALIGILRILNVI